MNNLIVKQLVVSVKVLKIGTKQCTISVFNQIQSIPLFKCRRVNDYYVTDYVPLMYEDINEWQLWGRVRYKNQTYLVASKDDLLFKCLLPNRVEMMKMSDDEDYIYWEEKIIKFYNLHQLFIAV